ncbi:serine-rich adhesin for platelets-like isoform X2 [Lytechinus variegatus]|uniref:serine-rich adhesin for platelets-like isoform X2 n=1 Tax=Lytechinus variegatus TaxID=7654 RepID=UPI001BB2B625|nr:serine-rich adhesin for platelets-like isoform X2 [Lytechinus variegatus]
MINLEHLTEEERKIIMDVLQRDEQLRQTEQERVKKLKTELHELRKKSAVKVDDDSVDSGKKVCARCREPLGTIFNSGEVCPRCQHKVCSNCKVILPNSKKWLCTICNKQLQIRLESGEAFGPKREGQPGAYGTELVKMSLGQSKTVLEPNIQVNGGPQSPADSGFHGRGTNVPSVGGSTTFDEDYPSDVSYEQSMVSGVESIGPSASQRGSIARHGAPMNHDDSTTVRNDVEGGMYGSADITMERVSPSTNRRSRQSDPKYNASESGIKSFHSGYTNINIEKGKVPFPLPNSYSKKDNQSSAVQSSSNKSLPSKFPFTTQSHKSVLLSGKEPRYDLSMDALSVDKIDDRQVYTTNVHSPQKIVPLVSKEGQDIAPSFKTSAQSHVLNPTPLSHTTTSSALLTNPHVGSSRFPAHVTNKRHANVGDFTKPTSNSYEYDTVSSDRVYLSSGVYDFQDQSVSDTVDDTAGEESSRQSDTDTQSITSSSTVAWDTLTDTKEMDNKKTTSSSEIDGQCIDSSESSGCLLQEDNLTKATLHQHGSTVASSGYESASSLSLSSEASLKTNSKTSNVSSFGSDLRRILMNERLAISLKDDYPSLQYFSYDSSPNDYVILEEEEISSQLSLSERIAPDLVPNIGNNNEDEPSRYDSVKSVCKRDMPLADIFYLQQQGSLLQNVQSELCDDMAKTSAPTDSIIHEQHLDSEEKVAKPNPSIEDSIPNESQQQSKVSDVQLSFHDLGSINSHYVTDLVDDDDESSDCSSIDISNLDFSESSESDTNLNRDQDNKRRVLKVGRKIATFENSERDKSVNEWGLSDDGDGLVPLVLPGMFSGSELSVKDKGAASGDDSDTLMNSLLKRLIRTPSTPQQPSPSNRKPLVSDDEDEDAFKRFSESLDISSDTDSLDEAHLEFDPSLIADSSEEKEACYKSKLDYNKALMRSLIKDLSTDDEQTLSEKEQTGQRKSGPLSQNSQSLAKQSPSALAGQTPEKTIDKQSKQSSKNTFAVEGSGNHKPRRKKKGKSKSKLDDAEASVGYASKKGLMRQSKTQFGVLSSTPDGKTQLYTLGEDKDRAESPVNLSKGRYTPLKDTGEGPQPLDRPTTPYVCQSLPQPRIHRKQPSSPGLPRSHNDNDSSSSSSSCEEDEEEDNRDEIDSISSRPFSPNTITRPFSFAGDDSSDGELSVIMEEPEDLDAELEQSYDSKL